MLNFFCLFLFFAQSALAQSLAVPANAEVKLVGNLTSVFPIVIGVVLAVVGVKVILKLFKSVVGSADYVADSHAGLHEFRPDLNDWREPAQWAEWSEVGSPGENAPGDFSPSGFIEGSDVSGAYNNNTSWPR